MRGSAKILNLYGITKIIFSSNIFPHPRTAYSPTHSPLHHAPHPVPTYPPPPTPLLPHSALQPRTFRHPSFSALMILKKTSL